MNNRTVFLTILEEGQSKIKALVDSLFWRIIKHGFISGISILFYYYIVQRTIVFYCSLKSGIVIPPYLFSNCPLNQCVFWSGLIWFGFLFQVFWFCFVFQFLIPPQVGQIFLGPQWYPSQLQFVTLEWSFHHSCVSISPAILYLVLSFTVQTQVQVLYVHGRK